MEDDKDKQLSRLRSKSKPGGSEKPGDLKTSHALHKTDSSKPQWSTATHPRRQESASRKGESEQYTRHKGGQSSSRSLPGINMVAEQWSPTHAAVERPGAVTEGTTSQMVQSPKRTFRFPHSSSVRGTSSSRIVSSQSQPKPWTEHTEDQREPFTSASGSSDSSSQRSSRRSTSFDGSLLKRLIATLDTVALNITATAIFEKRLRSKSVSCSDDSAGMRATETKTVENTTRREVPRAHCTCFRPPGLPPHLRRAFQLSVLVLSPVRAFGPVQGASLRDVQHSTQALTSDDSSIRMEIRRMISVERSEKTRTIRKTRASSAEQLSVALPSTQAGRDRTGAASKRSDADDDPSSSLEPFPKSHLMAVSHIVDTTRDGIPDVQNNGNIPATENADKEWNANPRRSASVASGGNLVTESDIWKLVNEVAKEGTHIPHEFQKVLKTDEDCGKDQPVAHSESDQLAWCSEFQKEQQYAMVMDAENTRRSINRSVRNEALSRDESNQFWGDDEFAEGADYAVTTFDVQDFPESICDSDQDEVLAERTPPSNKLSSTETVNTDTYHSESIDLDNNDDESEACSPGGANSPGQLYSLSSGLTYSLSALSPSESEPSQSVSENTGAAAGETRLEVSSRCLTMSNTVPLHHLDLPSSQENMSFETKPDDDVVFEGAHGNEQQYSSSASDCITSGVVCASSVCQPTQFMTVVLPLDLIASVERVDDQEPAVTPTELSKPDDMLETGGEEDTSHFGRMLTYFHQKRIERESKHFAELNAVERFLRDIVKSIWRFPATLVVGVEDEPMAKLKTLLLDEHLGNALPEMRCKFFEAVSTLKVYDQWREALTFEIGSQTRTVYFARRDTFPAVRDKLCTDFVRLFGKHNTVFVDNSYFPQELWNPPGSERDHQVEESSFGLPPPHCVLYDSEVSQSSAQNGPAPQTMFTRIVKIMVGMMSRDLFSSAIKLLVKCQGEFEVSFWKELCSEVSLKTMTDMENVVDTLCWFMTNDKNNIVHRDRVFIKAASIALCLKDFKYFIEHCKMETITNVLRMKKRTDEGAYTSDGHFLVSESHQLMSIQEKFVNAIASREFRLIFSSDIMRDHTFADRVLSNVEKNTMKSVDNESGLHFLFWAASYHNIISKCRKREVDFTEMEVCQAILGCCYWGHLAILNDIKVLLGKKKLTRLLGVLANAEVRDIIHGKLEGVKGTLEDAVAKDKLPFSEGQRLLTLAAWCGHLKLAERLFTHWRFPPDVKDDCNRTALMHMCARGKLPSSGWLKQSTTIAEEDKFGLTCYDYVLRSGAGSVDSLLTELLKSTPRDNDSTCSRPWIEKQREHKRRSNQSKLLAAGGDNFLGNLSPQVLKGLVQQIDLPLSTWRASSTRLTPLTE